MFSEKVLSRAEKNRLRAKAERILMGMTQSVLSNDEARVVVAHLLAVMALAEPYHSFSIDEVFEQAFKYCKDPQIKWINVSTLGNEFRVITLVLRTAEDKDYNMSISDLCDVDGAFSYAFNFDAPDCSELGYCFFEVDSNSGRIRRIG